MSALPHRRSSRDAAVPAAPTEPPVTNKWRPPSTEKGFRQRMTAEEEIQISTDISVLQSWVNDALMQIEPCAQILRRTSKRKETTSAMHVDRLTEAVQESLSLRPRPRTALQISGIWKQIEERRWRLAMSGYRIAVGEARKMTGRGLDLEDLIHEGVIGLVDAAKRFDPKRNLRFSTYARWWVRARMMRSIDTKGSSIRLPGGLLEVIRRIEMVKAQLEKQDGSWTEEQIADLLAMEVSAVRSACQAYEDTQAVSLASTPSSNNNEQNTKSLEDHLSSDDPSPEHSAIVSEVEEATRVAIERLDPKYRQAIRLYLGFDKTSDERVWTLQGAAEVAGVSRERIRQILLGVRTQISADLSPPASSDPAPAAPSAEEIVEILRERKRASSHKITTALYGLTYRTAHLSLVEVVLSSLEESGLVVAFTSDRKVLWGLRNEL